MKLFDKGVKAVDDLADFVVALGVKALRKVGVSACDVFDGGDDALKRLYGDGGHKGGDQQNDYGQDRVARNQNRS